MNGNGNIELMTQQWVDEGPAAEDEDDDSVEVYFEIPKAPCQFRSTGNDDLAASAAVTSSVLMSAGSGAYHHQYHSKRHPLGKGNFITFI